MKPAPFDYAVSANVGDVVSLLNKHQDEAKIIAGGQSLVPLLSMRFARPSLLIDVNKIADLDYIREADGGLAIGALTRHRTVERSDLVRKRQPLLAAGVHNIGHPQIRNRGTIGGSIAHADPAAELPTLALALDAQMRLTGPNGTRSVAAKDFFVGLMTTALEPNEMLTEIRFPAWPERTGYALQEVARRHGDFAMAGSAVWMTLDGAGKCSAARVVLIGVGPMPLRATAAEQAVVGSKPSDAVFEQAGEKAKGSVTEAVSDVHGSSEFRQHLAGVLTRRALAEAATRAAGGR